jgi:hypothetical protein
MMAATMTIEFYQALREVGVSDEKAQRLVGYFEDHKQLSKKDIAALESNVHKLDKELVTINGRITLLQWMLGIVIAATVLPLLKPLLQ